MISGALSIGGAGHRAEYRRFFFLNLARRIAGENIFQATGQITAIIITS
jgi:hypothetical protein